ncbi:MAG: hypothetical protein JO269_11530 [Burkholderiaceae bacterium]|nr:hypothetical protein [Burkholderiaceae bacterium]
MSVHDFTEYKQRLAGPKPKKITFRSSVFKKDTGEEGFLNISFNIADGDVGALIEMAKECGGIPYAEANGKTHFLPWPPAAIEIEDV